MRNVPPPESGGGGLGRGVLGAARWGRYRLGAGGRPPSTDYKSQGAVAGERLSDCLPAVRYGVGAERNSTVGELVETRGGGPELPSSPSTGNGPR